MNFMVSHLSRKAPIKATPILGVKGMGTHDGLSKRKSHYNDRRGCVRLFVQTFGYNPLVVSEHRADSLLYDMSIDDKK